MRPCRIHKQGPVTGVNSSEVVVAEQLTKTYPDGTEALAGVDFGIDEGLFFGFLGPNGAGKSTLLKILSTLLKSTTGRAFVDGIDVGRKPDEVRRRIGFAMQDVGLDDLATGRDFLRLQGILYGMSGRDAGTRADELLELVGLTAVSGKKVGTYSGGMRRRIDLAGALVHRPRILFLDEPTTGLDPQSRLSIWEYLTALNNDGMTIFMTTQVMDEADSLCETLAIIDQGKIVADGTPDSLKAELGSDVLQFVLGDDQFAEAERVLTTSELSESTTGEGNDLSVTVKDGSAAAPEIMKILHANGVTVQSVSIAKPTLDDVFLKHTGRSIRDDDTSGDGVENAWRPFLGLSKK